MRVTTAAKQSYRPQPCRDGGVRSRSEQTCQTRFLAAPWRRGRRPSCVALIWIGSPVAWDCRLVRPRFVGPDRMPSPYRLRTRCASLCRCSLGDLGPTRVGQDQCLAVGLLRISSSDSSAGDRAGHDFPSTRWLGAVALFAMFGASSRSQRPHRRRGLGTGRLRVLKMPCVIVAETMRTPCAHPRCSVFISRRAGLTSGRWPPAPVFPSVPAVTCVQDCG